MELEFTLTVTVRGKSLNEIDDGLVEAAGQRLQARISKKLTMNGAEIGNHVATNVAAVVKQGEELRQVHLESTESEEEGEVTNKSAEDYIKEAPTHAAVQEDAPHQARSATTGKPRGRQPGMKKDPVTGKMINPKATGHQALAKSAPEPGTAPAKKPNKEGAIAALNKVFSKFGMAQAQDCLGKFGAPRVGALDEKDYGAFIQHCEATVSA